MFRYFIVLKVVYYDFVAYRKGAKKFLAWLILKIKCLYRKKKKKKKSDTRYIVKKIAHSIMEIIFPCG